MSLFSLAFRYQASFRNHISSDQRKAKALRIIEEYIKQHKSVFIRTNGVRKTGKNNFYLTCDTNKKFTK